MLQSRLQMATGPNVSIRNAMLSEYNREQKRSRLRREIDHFQAQVEKFQDRADAQRSRCHTIALRCLKRRVDTLAKLK